MGETRGSGGAGSVTPAGAAFQQAADFFLKVYPGGFSGEQYFGDRHTGERAYKWRAHRTFEEELGGQKMRQVLDSDLPKLVELSKRCIGMVNLLYRIEAAAFHDALKDAEAARQFFARLADLLDTPSPSEAVFQPYADAVMALPAQRGRVATWPVATILPFLAQPDRHMFLKPEPTKRAAERLGFELNYRSEPNWITYECLLSLAAEYRKRLTDLDRAELKPRDLIDVQSFFWVTRQT